jgi:hypothetical protein
VTLQLFMMIIGCLQLQSRRAGLPRTYSSDRSFIGEAANQAWCDVEKCRRRHCNPYKRSASACRVLASFGFDSKDQLELHANPAHAPVF